MEKQTTLDLILTLIKADMRNYKLILGLDKAGLTAEDFYTDLSRSVMLLMEFREDDKDDSLFELYHRFMDRLADIHLYEFNQAIKLLSFELYTELLAEKKVRERGRVVEGEVQ